jgi:16S rRNA (cytosine1402-N4)-methyltransferase
MVREVVAFLDCKPRGVYVDATVGCGGHAAALLEASSPAGFLLGIDRDGDALREAETALQPYRGRFLLRRADFRNLGKVLQREGVEGVNGMLLDLGISSLQVDRSDRGFSFRSEGPLDMRMDRQHGITAERLIREISEDELATLIRDFGEEKRARRVARAVKRASEEGPLSTSRLAEVVEEALGGRRPRRGRIHPATRTFQALRIAVNDELGALEDFLEEMPNLLLPGGRCCCIAYHSLEDRIVKNAFRDLAGRGTRRREPQVELLTKKPVRPEPEEVLGNPRSRSARLRAVKKLEN